MCPPLVCYTSDVNHASPSEDHRVGPGSHRGFRRTGGVQVLILDSNLLMGREWIVL